MSFTDLPIAELRRLADDVYPVELSEEENKDKKKAALALEAVGANWSEYLKMHATDEIREKFAAEYNALVDPDNRSGGDGVVTSEQINSSADEPVAAVEEVKIITREEPKVTEKYLVKMTRENPLYQVGPYKFTKTHPYALVEGKDLRSLMEHEGGGFRQAYPDEIEDYYNG